MEALSGLIRNVGTEATPIGVGAIAMGTPRIAGRATANTETATAAIVGGAALGAAGPFQTTATGASIGAQATGMRPLGRTGWPRCRHLWATGETLWATGSIRGRSGAKAWSAPIGGSL
jgi:hypothetical protein